jgi:sugar fermentation stimulation protein A
MKIIPPLLPGLFRSRYKRFFADVIDAGGQTLTIHCPNTGSMNNCMVPNSDCWYSMSDNAKRKLPGTLELITTVNGNLAGVNTSRANHLVREAIEAGIVPELRDYQTIRSEVKYGTEKSRIDFLLEDSVLGCCYVEVKNVTLETGSGLVAFPDAVTARGTKHLRELITMVNQGHRAVLFFCVQVANAREMWVASDVDPTYATTLAEAVAAGVEVIAWRALLSPQEILLEKSIPFRGPLAPVLSG